MSLQRGIVAELKQFSSDGIDLGKDGGRAEAARQDQKKNPSPHQSHWH